MDTGADMVPVIRCYARVVCSGRQWLNEFVNASELRVIGAQSTGDRKLSQLFPSAFGPDNLGNACPLLQQQGGCPVPPPAPTGANLEALAWHAAKHAYAPYTKGISGVAISARSPAGAMVQAWGGVLENAAFDPTVDPMQVALIDLITKGVSDYSAIVAVVHAEPNATTVTRYLARSRALAAAIAPAATFSYSATPPAGKPRQSGTLRGRPYAHATVDVRR